MWDKLMAGAEETEENMAKLKTKPET